MAARRGLFQQLAYEFNAASITGAPDGRRENEMNPETISISVEGFEIVSHILTLGYATMAAALCYFVLTKNDVLPKYRMSSVISGVVMVSALLLSVSSISPETSVARTIPSSPTTDAI